MSELPAEMMLLPGGPVWIEWRRSTRARRVSLRIDPLSGSVVVTLPMRAARNAGMALLMDHAHWVSDRVAALPEAVKLADGAIVPVADVPHRIRHRTDKRGGAWIEDMEIHVAGAPEFLPRRVRDLLRTEAQKRLGTMAVAKSALIERAPQRVTVKDTRTRWGSCAPDGSLAFSWRLVMAPEFVQDYVVAHEVAHLRHMNHGPRFWALVDKLTDHAPAAIPWLRDNGARLLRIG
jgi:predicted metal-dependent hydrolase